MHARRIGEIVGLVVTALLYTQHEAHATHKNWLSKNTGNQCNFDHSSAADEWRVYGVKWWPYPDPGYRKFVECPVSLGARWGSSGAGGYALSGTRSAKAMWANIYVNNPEGTVFWCNAVARMATQAMYWSGSALLTDPGDQRISLMTNTANWGGDLQTHRTETVKSLDIQCEVPASGIITGYKVKLCQRGTGAGDCFDGGSNDQDIDSSGGQSSPLQTSGIECAAQNNYGWLTRSESGIKNQGTTFTGEDKVECPITSPADDSYEHARELTITRVYFSGTNGGPGCGTSWPPTCPQCSLIAVDHNYGMYWSGSFVYPEFGGGFVEQPTWNMSLGAADRGMTVECELPPGQTISGLTTQASLTRISGGI